MLRPEGPLLRPSPCRQGTAPAPAEPEPRCKHPPHGRPRHTRGARARGELARAGPHRGEHRTHAWEHLRLFLPHQVHLFCSTFAPLNRLLPTLSSQVAGGPAGVRGSRHRAEHSSGWNTSAGHAPCFSFWLRTTHKSL